MKYICFLLPLDIQPRPIGPDPDRTRGDRGTGSGGPGVALRPPEKTKRPLDLSYNLH